MFLFFFFNLLMAVKPHKQTSNLQTTFFAILNILFLKKLKNRFFGILILFVFLDHTFGVFSDVRGPFRTNNPSQSPTISNKQFVHNCSHYLDFSDFVCRKMSKHIIKVCSHIQKNTQNLNTIIKITIYNAKYPTTPKYF